jgi:hypothetical protein
MWREEKIARDAPPFSRPLAAADVPPEGLDHVVTANEAERAAAARANGLPALSRLDARLRIARSGSGGLQVEGEVSADARRTCVVTLEEFDAHVVEPVRLRFAPPADAGRRLPGAGRSHAGMEETSDHHVGADDEDPPDLLIDGTIDLGAIACEFLTLGLDPYPRKPGAQFAEPAPAGGGVDETTSPFARLRLAPKTRAP